MTKKWYVSRTCDSMVIYSEKKRRFVTQTRMVLNTPKTMTKKRNKNLNVGCSLYSLRLARRRSVVPRALHHFVGNVRKQGFHRGGFCLTFPFKMDEGRGAQGTLSDAVAVDNANPSCAARAYGIPALARDSVDRGAVVVQTRIARCNYCTRNPSRSRSACLQPVPAEALVKR